MIFAGMVKALKRFRARLTFIFIILIGLADLSSGLFSAKLLKDSHVDALKGSMLREIQVIIVMMDWKAGADESAVLSYYEAKAKELRKTADARVTFIRSNGVVVGDSDNDPATMDNHSTRPEIVEAKSQGTGYSIRYSDTLKTNMLYVASIVRSGDGSFQGYVRLSMSLAAVDKSIEQLWTYLVYGLLICFAVSVTISYRVGRSLTLPLEKITKVAYEITHMNYKSRVTLRDRDEIGQLGQAINTMADSLQLQMNRITENESRLKSVLENMISGVVMIDRDERIVVMNKSAEEIIGFGTKELLGKKYDEAKQQNELKQMIRECIENKEHVRDEITFYFPVERMLEINLVPMMHTDGEWGGVVMVLHDISAVRRLERIRSEFVANVSHELKTPIAAVKGFAETLLAGAVKDEETARTFLQIIFDESERLNRLIGDILELSKIESKRIPLYFSPVHMHSFVSNTLDMMRTQSDKKHIELEMLVNENLYIEADEDRLRQIFINLLSNGIIYTPEGGRVKIKVEAFGTAANEEDYENVRIIISDTGIGIPKKDLPRIFERFYRVDKARSRSSGGTGLGLSIVKHLVEMHKGSIRVESDVGYGTRFIIELPVLH